MEKPSIRRAAPADAAPFQAVIEAAYAPHRAALPDLPDVAAGVAEDIDRHHVLVAETDGQITGGLILRFDADHALLANVAVSPDAARSGIGRALIAAAEADARDRGLPEMRLATHARMPGNVRLYEGLGWRVTDRDAARIRMSKTLT